jgi:acyl carrier protein
MIMDIDLFIKNFSAQFDETDIESFTADTQFRELDEWSSLIALSIMAMVDEEYNVMIKGDEMRTSKTIKDLYDIVNSKV